MRRVHETIVAVGKQNLLYISLFVCEWVSACVCVRARLRACFSARSLTYPACNAHEPCCLRPLCLHHIIGDYLINGAIFGKKSLNIKCVFLLSLQLLFETFLILRRTKRDIVISVKTFSCEVPVILV